MKKLLLTLTTLTLMSSTAMAIEGYAPDFTPNNETTNGNYTEVEVDINNDNPNLKGIFGHENEGGEKTTYTLKDKYVLPTNIIDKKLVVFTSDNSNFTNKEELDKITPKNIKEGSTYKLVFNTDNETNNRPQYMYVYDTVAREIHKVYKKDGTRGVIRQILTADADKVVKQGTTTVDKAWLSTAKGYVRAKDLPKYAIGEIKEKAANVAPGDVDLALMPVSGDTVWRYLKDNMPKPAQPGEAVEEFAIDGDVLSHKTPGDHILRGIKDPIKDNDAATKKYVDDKIAALPKPVQQQVVKAVAGVSTAIAIANVPLEYKSDKPNSFGVGVGYYGGHVGFALGYGRKLLNDTLTLKVTSSVNTAADVAAGMGAAFTW